MTKITKYLKPFFFSSDSPAKLKVPYVFATLFSFMFFIAVIGELILQFYNLYLYNIENLNVNVSFLPLISVLIAYIVGIISMYNWGKRKKEV